MILAEKQDSKEMLQTDNKDLVAFKFLDCGFENRALYFSKINEFFFNLLVQKQIPTHYLGQADETVFIAKKLEVMPFQVVVRNFAVGSACVRLNAKRGTWFPFPYLEFLVDEDFENKNYYSESEFFSLNIVSFDEGCLLADAAREISTIIYNKLLESGLFLVDLKIKFARDTNGGYFVSDELTLDKMRVWTKDKKESLDFDAYCDNESFEKVASEFIKKISL